MGNFCTDKLIGKLVALLRVTNPARFDWAVEKAKKQLDGEVKQAKRNDLEKLFDSQIETLKDRGVPEQIVEILQDQKGAVVRKSVEMAIGDGNIPFLPVIPRSFRSPYDLMAMVRNGSKVGLTYLNPTQISDVVDVPKGPYYIYDVEDGNSMCGTSPKKAEKVFKQQKRSPLTADEVMALATHTDVLSGKSMLTVLATGSRYWRADRALIMCLDNTNQLRLDWGCVDFAGDREGAASCGSR